MGILQQIKDEFFDEDVISQDDVTRIRELIWDGKLTGEKGKKALDAILLAHREGWITESPKQSFQEFHQEFPNDLCLKSYWLGWMGPFARSLEIQQRHHSLRTRYFVGLNDPVKLPIIRYFGGPRQGEQPEILYSAPLPPSTFLQAEIEDWARPDFPTKKPGIDKVISWLSYSDEKIKTINGRIARYQEMLDVLNEYFQRWPIKFEIGPETIQKLKQQGSFRDGVWQTVWKDAGITGFPIMVR